MNRTQFSVNLLLILLFCLCFTCRRTNTQIEKRSALPIDSKFKPAKLAPGTALVLVEVIKHSLSESANNWVVRIDSIYAYGPATPILSRASEIRLEMHPQYIHPNKKPVSNALLKGKKYKLSLAFSGRQLGKARTNQWRIVKILD